MAFVISEIEGAKTKDTAWVNRCANQHYPGDEIFKDLHEIFYDKFFASHLTNKSSDEQWNTIAIIKDWLAKKNLTFSDINNTKKYSTPDKWLKHMLKCSLSNWTTCRNPASRSNKTKLVNQTFPTAKFFIGREGIISSIKSKLERSHIVILYGTAGMGKSALAREFADRNRKYYSCIQEVIADLIPPPIHIKLQK